MATGQVSLQRLAGRSIICTMSDTTPWSTPVAFPKLGAGETHVWRARLDIQSETLVRLQNSLDAAELERASRFHFARDREHYVACRGILRELLGAYLHRSAASLQFQYGPYGKPHLSQEASPAAIEFNVSHSHGVGVAVFARGRELGIDVEQMRPEFGGEDIAQRYFSAAEVAELHTLGQAEKASGFFRGWTRKEAYIKARGLGLQIPLDSFSVALASGNTPLLHSQDSTRWALRSFEAWSNFAAAIVEECPQGQLSFYNWAAELTPGDLAGRAI